MQWAIQAFLEVSDKQSLHHSNVPRRELALQPRPRPQACTCLTICSRQLEQEEGVTRMPDLDHLQPVHFLLDNPALSCTNSLPDLLFLLRPSVPVSPLHFLHPLQQEPSNVVPGPAAPLTP